MTDKRYQNARPANPSDSLPDRRTFDEKGMWDPRRFDIWFGAEAAEAISMVENFDDTALFS